MNSISKNIRLKLFALFGKFVTDITNTSELLDLIKRLKPMDPNMEMIRLGAPNDGGYVVPNDLEGIVSCFSPGVSEVSEFENDCANLGMEVFLADYSVEKPACNNQNFHFTKKFVGVTTNDTFMTLDDWINEHKSNPNEELLLQIDIEGFEYEVFLASSPKVLSRFRIIVVEFHRLDHWWSKPVFKIVSRAMEKLIETHQCVHIHPNNIRGSVKRRGIEMPLNMEFTFLRRDRAKFTHPFQNFPHSLDADNSTEKTLDLPSCWYQ